MQEIVNHKLWFHKWGKAVQGFRELENLEKKKETFDQVFKGLTGH